MKIPEEYPENSGITKIPTKIERLGQILSFWNHEGLESYLRYNSGGWARLNTSKMTIECLPHDENERMERFYWDRTNNGGIYDD